MRTFIRCAWANKLTLVGYLFLLIAGTSAYLDLRPLILQTALCWFAGTAFGITTGGIESYLACKRAEQVLEKRRGALDPQKYFLLWSYKSNRPCPRAGYRVANEEWRRKKSST